MTKLTPTVNQKRAAAANIQLLGDLLFQLLSNVADEKQDYFRLASRMILVSLSQKPECSFRHQGYLSE